MILVLTEQQDVWGGGEGLILYLPPWETHQKKFLGAKAPWASRVETSAPLWDPPCVQSPRTAGRCSSCLPSSPLLGLTAPRARSRPGWLSVRRWSRCRPPNGGCCFLKKQSKSIRGCRGWPLATEPVRARHLQGQGGSLQRSLGYLGFRQHFFWACLTAHVSEEDPRPAGLRPMPMALSHPFPCRSPHDHSPAILSSEGPRDGLFGFRTGLAKANGNPDKFIQLGKFKRYIWVLSTYPLHLGFKWNPTRKGGAELFQRECSVFLLTPPFHFTVSSLEAWLLMRSCESVSEFRGDVPAPNLEFWAMAWLTGPSWLWSPVYKIWGLKTALSQEVENGDRNQP